MSRVALVGLPYDAGSSFQRGPADAPSAIRTAFASPSSNLTTELGVDLARASSRLHDAGDLALAEGAAVEQIEAGVAALLDQGFRPLALGGDHSVTYPLLRAFRGRYPRLTLLQVDAHPDLYDEFAGDRFSHACPFARILEAKLVTRLVQVGIRCMNAAQQQQAERFGVEVHEMRSWAGPASLRLEPPVYVSFDMDGVDPAFAPGVSHREPGGFTAREAIALLHSVPAPIVGADMVELNPRKDPSGITAALAGRLLKELVGRMLEG
ncbi:MAG TPA: agmatinase [Gemmatimonadales bacterium]|nr:agmatinase [Gemmatimonadales bacterium]